MIVDKNFITDKQKEFIDKIFSNQDVPFYYHTDAAHNDGLVHFVHHIIKDYKINSDLFELLAKDIFINYCKQNNIKYTKIYRCAINVCFPLNKIKTCNIHTDHTFDYKHLLIYLNDSDGETVLLEDDKETEKIRITPEKYKGVMFNKCWHYHVLPTTLDRKVLVYTFD